MTLEIIPAICVECIHYFNKEPDGERSEVWYNHICHASPIEPVFDFVLGKEVQPLGDTHKYCRDVNKYGFCSLFKKMTRRNDG